VPGHFEARIVKKNEGNCAGELITGSKLIKDKQNVELHWCRGHNCLSELIGGEVR
jgi:hypothetical protein